MADAPLTPSSDPHLGNLAGLHRMSRTAGLGSNEYTAVNTTSVVAVIVAAASALALVTPFFLLLAVLGVVLATVAIVQIRSSNGTQTGLPLAIIALLLSVGFSGVSGYKYFSGIAQERADFRQIDELVGHFGKLIAEGKSAEAYELTDTRFKEQVTLPQFQNLFDEQLAKAPTLGALQGMRTNKLFVIESDPDSGLRMAIGNGYLDTKLRSGDDAIKTEMRFRNKDNQWRVFAIPQFFAGKAAAAGAASGGAGGAPAGPAGPP
ncbi:MAG: hypothetical protein JWM57_1321, partial [Phycisphaerales bacterium]|nr:hypothetical protein [Phycisphaerales bacterium]